MDECRVDKEKHLRGQVLGLGYGMGHEGGVEAKGGGSCSGDEQCPCSRESVHFNRGVNKLVRFDF